MANEEKAATRTQEEAPAVEESAATEAGQDLARELDEARRKAEEHWNEFLRARAELENLRKRAERDVENAHKYALEKFTRDLLPVKDSLEMGLAAASDEQADVAKLREGTELTLKMLAKTLEKYGIRELNPVGEKFNPEQHEAMAMQESDKEPSTVLTVVQKGYLLNDRMIRPAMVIVSKAAADGGKGVDERA